MGTLFKYVFRILLLLLIVAFGFSFAFNRWIKKDASGDAETMAPSGIFEQVDGVKYHIVKRGIGTKTFLLLHGFGSSSYTWNKEMDELSNMGRVIAIDFPGFGYSDHNPSIDFRTEAEVRRISNLLALESSSKVVVVGHSYGGKIALALAQEHPEQVEKLILVSPAVYRNTKPGSGLLLSIPEISKAFLKISFSTSRLQQSYLKNFANTAQVTSEEIATFLDPYKVKGVEDSLIARAKQSDKVKYEVSKIAPLPSLIIWGEKDRIIPRSDIERLRADLASEPKVVILSNVGHLAHEEAPSQFMTELKSFLASN